MPMALESLADRQAGDADQGVSHPKLESFVYDDAIVRAFLLATIFWGVVSFVVGLIAAIQLALPQMNLGISLITFGRLRPVHTNAAIFAFAGNAIFAAVYHSTQRLCKARMFSDRLSWFHFWGWQLIIVAAALSLLAGFTSGKEYAELEWPIDIAIAVVWVAFCDQLPGDAGSSARASHVRGAVVPHRHRRHHRRVAHLQQPGGAGWLVQELLGVCGGPGCVHAMVVWAQRGRFSADHAVPGHHVLLPAQGRGPSGVFVPVEHPAFLGAGVHLYLGGSAPSALHGVA
jgi:hypothetical protein